MQIVVYDIEADRESRVELSSDESSLLIESAQLGVTHSKFSAGNGGGFISVSVNDGVLTVSAFDCGSDDPTLIQFDNKSRRWTPQPLDRPPEAGNPESPGPHC